MSALSRVGRMTRVMVFVLALLLTAVSACSNDSDGLDAETFKTEMDAEVKVLLPDLMEAFGGDLDGMQADFRERGGFGIWDYAATGTVLGLPGTDDQALAAGAEALTKHGFTVETDDEEVSVRAAKGDIRVVASSARPGDDTGVASLDLTITSAHTMSGDDDFAENAPAEDYLAFLEPR